LAETGDVALKVVVSMIVLVAPYGGLLPILSVVTPSDHQSETQFIHSFEGTVQLTGIVPGIWTAEILWVVGAVIVGNSEALRFAFSIGAFAYICEKEVIGDIPIVTVAADAV